MNSTQQASALLLVILHCQVIGLAGLEHLSQTQFFFQVDSHIIHFRQLPQHRLNPLELLVVLVVQKLKNGNAVLQLKSKRMHQVVDYHNVFQILVRYDPQILNKKPIVSLHTILPVHHSQNRLLLLVQVVNDRLSVILSPRSENINVVNLTHVLQKLQTVRPHIKLEFVPLECELHISFFVGKD